ncbi:MAG TPA: hypothetical protein VKA32_07500 [Gammaproteobacteria bacterium]|nr:hypothetical protein [Gammaproteobacteria bacterium]
MTAAPLLFAHANGFPAGSYRRFFEALARSLRNGWRELLTDAR